MEFSTGTSVWFRPLPKRMCLVSMVDTCGAIGYDADSILSSLSEALVETELRRLRGDA